MQTTLFNPNAPKKPAHLSINSDLLQQAKLKRINISDVCEKGLAEALRERNRQDWLEQNREAIAEYGRFIDKNGCFSDKLRCF